MEQEDVKASSEWAKLLVPVLLPMLIMGCIFLTNIVWTQTSEITELKTRVADRTETIKTYGHVLESIDSEIQRIDLGVSKLESRISVAEQSQGKVVDILDDLNKTLERINVTVGKLETRLDYTENKG